MSELRAKVIVVGGGAAGLIAAGTAAEAGAKVVLLEQNDRLGKKLLITGKGRCNVTNNCTPDEVLKNVPRNGRFLYSCLDAFSPEQTMAFFERLGCSLKTERGNRVFPNSDQSADVLRALQRYLREHQVEVRLVRVRKILVRDGEVAGVETDQGPVYGRRVILCTGGCSYPLTGSTGDGYRMTSELGHTIQTPVGSLVPLVEDGGWCAEMQGLALKNVSVKLINQKGKSVFEDFGELLFTHFGLSGPTILSASAHMKDKESYTVVIDLKPALDEQKLDQRILRDFEQYANRTIEHTLQELYPRSLIPVMLKRCEIDPLIKTNSITRQQRRALLELTKKFTVSIAGKRPVEEAIITSGGVRIKEIDPRTMESKLIHGLFIAGELLDVDAYTGGFNLQIAWSTGRAAGIAAAEQDIEQEDAH